MKRIYLIQEPLRFEIQSAIKNKIDLEPFMNKVGVDTSFKSKDKDLVSGIYKCYLEDIIKIKIKERK